MGALRRTPHGAGRRSMHTRTAPWRRRRTLRDRWALGRLLLVGWALEAVACRSPTPAIPASATPLEAIFENGVQLVGYEIPPGPFTPGSKVPIVLYFRAPGKVTVDPLRQVHETGDCPGQNLHGDTRPLLDIRERPPSFWEPGAIIRDSVELTVPQNIATDEVTFWASLTMGAQQRLKFTSAAPTDLNQRIQLATRPVRWTAPSRVPRLSVPSIDASITLDGRLDEPAWQTAAVTSRFVRDDGSSVQEATVARVLRKGHTLFIGFEVSDSDLFSPYRERDDSVEMQDSVGVFFQPDSTKPGFMEIAVSPANVILDRRHPLCQEEEELEWQSGVRSAVQVQGTLNQPGDVDRGYTVELEIPLEGWPEGAGETASLSPGTSTGISSGSSRIGRLNLLRNDTTAPYQRPVERRFWSPPHQRDPFAPSRFGQLEY